MIRASDKGNRRPCGLGAIGFLVTVALILSFSVVPAMAAAKAKKSGDDDSAWANDSDLFGGDLYQKVPEVADPLEPLNRVVFQFNDKLYFWVLKPVAKGYKFVVPEPARVGVRNFFYNLLTPVRLVNCLLQGKIKDSGAELGAFYVNTTVGILGIWRPSERDPALKGSDEDLGQTLATWGVGNGIYLVVPVFGPSTLRDAAGKVADGFLNPVMYVNPTEAAIGIDAFKTVNNTSLRLGDYESIKKAALDPYVAFRNGYIQYRIKQIRE